MTEENQKPEKKTATKRSTKKSTTKKVSTKKAAAPKKEAAKKEVEEPKVENEMEQAPFEVDTAGTEVKGVEEPKTKEEKIEQLLNSMDGVNQVPEKEPELTKQARGWRDWLAYQKMTPEEFLKKYPRHKFKNFVEEIIEKRVKK